MPVWLDGPRACGGAYLEGFEILIPAPRKTLLYPPLLDLAEFASVAPGVSKLLIAAAAAVAPKYEDLLAVGLKEYVDPRWDDVVEQDGTGREELVIRGLAEGIARHPTALLLRLPRVDRWDYVSLSLLTHFLAHPKSTIHHVVIGLPEGSRSPHAIAPYVSQAKRLPPNRGRLCLQPNASSAKKALNSYTCCDPAGWGYLRRALLAAHGRDEVIMRKQHAFYFQGFRDIGRDFLYLHLKVHAVLATSEEKQYSAKLHLAAARLAPRVRGSGGYRASVRHYMNAIRQLSGGETASKIRIMQELANVHAVQREPTALCRARSCYSRATQLLAALEPGSEEHVGAQIRLCNGLALVEYHAGRNQEALTLEAFAIDLAENMMNVYPRIADWALPLLKLNTARLVERRFGDSGRASSLLSEVVHCTKSASTRARARIELGRLQFEAGAYRECIDTMHEALIEANDLDESETVTARLLRIAAMLRIDDRESASAEANGLGHILQVIVPGVFDEALSALRSPRQSQFTRNS